MDAVARAPPRSPSARGAPRGWVAGLFALPAAGSEPESVPQDLSTKARGEACTPLNMDMYENERETGCVDRDFRPYIVSKSRNLHLRGDFVDVLPLELIDAFRS